MEHNIAIALGLTILAGLSTGIGSCIACFAQRTSTSFLSATLGFSAGVMIYVSFMELLTTSLIYTAAHFSRVTGGWLTVTGFFAGIFLIMIIDYKVPVHENPHHARLPEEMAQRIDTSALRRTGVLTALAIGIHNFPEGIATFMSAINDPALGVTIAIAIALHNIPEGISVAVPIYYATGSRKRAFWYSLLSGLAEPIGAFSAYLVLRPFLNEGVMGVVLAAVAGIMVFISLDQLIPNAKKYDTGHQAVYGLIAGMAVMAVTLLMLR
jgi:ZIP family zinc transporter